MLEAMTEPDETWERTAAEAAERAKSAGRGDVADYLLLKASNDQIRAAGVRWLLDSAAAIAAEAIRNQTNITIENQSAHRFAVGNSNLTGAVLTIRQGVRCLTVEAGWTRAPGDGFMRGGALALGRVSHFGMSRQNEELSLARENDLINWFAGGVENKRNLFDSNDLQRHFRLFLSA